MQTCENLASQNTFGKTESTPPVFGRSEIKQFFFSEVLCILVPTLSLKPIYNNVLKNVLHFLCVQHSLEITNSFAAVKPVFFLVKLFKPLLFGINVNAPRNVVWTLPNYSSFVHRTILCTDTLLVSVVCPIRAWPTRSRGHYGPSCRWDTVHSVPSRKQSRPWDQKRISSFRK